MKVAMIHLKLDTVMKVAVTHPKLGTVMITCVANVSVRFECKELQGDK